MSVDIPAPVLTEEAIDRWLAWHSDWLDTALMRGSLKQDVYDNATRQLNRRYDAYLEALAYYHRLEANSSK